MNAITISQKMNKFLNFSHYEFIVSQMMKFNAEYKTYKHRFITSVKTRDSMRR